MTVILRGLNRPVTTISLLEKIAVNRMSAGFRAGDYPVVQQALLNTLQKSLGDDFTDETRDAWIAAYQLLSGVMCHAAYGKLAA